MIKRISDEEWNEMSTAERVELKRQQRQTEFLANIGLTAIVAVLFIVGSIA